MAPEIESDFSTFALDTRTWFQKFVMSDAGQLSIIIGQIILTIITRKWIIGASTRVNSSFYTMDAVAIQTRLIMAQTLVELGFNIPQAYVYFNVPGGNAVGWMNVAFCFLPYISSRPGFIKTIGQEYSPQLCLSIAMKSAQNLTDDVLKRMNITRE